MNTSPDFFQYDNPSIFEELAPSLASHRAVKNQWGVLSIAQCAQENALGERTPCWCLEYLQDAFSSYVGRLSPEEHAELVKIWEFR